MASRNVGTLVPEVGEDLSLPAVVHSMVGRVKSWDAVMTFCESVLSQKDAAERERELRSSCPSRSRRTGPFTPLKQVQGNGFGDICRYPSNWTRDDGA